MYERYGVAIIRDSVSRFGGDDSCEIIALVAWWLSSFVSVITVPGWCSDEIFFSVSPSSVEGPLLNHLLSFVKVRFSMRLSPPQL